MSNSKTAQDVELLKSDIASFASSLGFSADSSLPYSGFNDVDFRKTGPLKPPKPPKTPKQNSQLEKKPSNTQTPKTDKNTKNNQRPKPNKPPVLSLDDSNKSNRFSRDPDKFKNLPALPLVKASALSLWYEDESELEKKLFGEEGKGKKAVNVRNVEELKRLVEKKMELGERLMCQYAKDYELSKGKSGDMKMVLASQRSGTAADKVSAFSFVVADNAVANLKSLDGLLGLVTSKVGKRYAFTGFEALKELFISKLLPDRKLKTLIQRPVDELPETKDGYSLLLFWYWEDCLKQSYERFVVALEEASRDMLPALKDKALKLEIIILFAFLFPSGYNTNVSTFFYLQTMYVLLKSKPEQERKLLSSLVNKLGDPQNKGASNADYYLSNLLSDHPNMKAVVIDEVDTFLFRPHLGLRAKYHAVNFLSQIRLSHKGDGPRVAKRLIEVYFALFKVLISEAEKGQPVDDKSNKAVKSAHKSKENKRKGSGESHVELDSRLLSALLMVHSKNFNVGVQALMLLDKISSKNQVVSDRFYRALYSKLLLPAAMNSSKASEVEIWLNFAEMFIGLLLRAMKSDVNLKRVSAFSKRILQVSLQQPPQYACGCLFLISEVLKARPQLWNMMLQNESVDEDLEHFEDIVEETASEPSLASKKEENNADICGGEAANSDSYSSEDEGVLPSSYSDDDMSEDEKELFIRETPKDQHHQEPKIISNQNALTSPKSTAKPFLPGGYDPRHREPSYSNADRASWWELMVLSTHVHPSVATMAATLLSGANIVYNGNPLNDLSLTSFLDKFMEKKPKASSWHGGSQIEPAKKLDMNNYLIGQEILSLAETDVPPEDLVFHKFYMNKMNSSKKPKKKKKKKAAEGEAAEELFDVGGNDVDDDYVDGGDDSDNEEIENILDSANPSLDADGDYDYDDLDNVANEDDDVLIGDASDAEMDIHSDDTDEEGFDVGAGTDSINDDGDDAIAIGDADDLSDGEDEFHQRKRKRKSGKKTSASPFASLEDYEHLLNEDSPSEKDSIKTKKFKPRKKKLSK
ncbi:CCAAT/enhancer-binding protein zeta [Gossypium australe]|uniref:CCAAT/enhancer-binding protein zeta n=1 Tax=Gossypium australe TaxID=47621 RepID=A0A5B6U255_9ROSI|nr:CCAAT/enhancer-binding protein zeta [Gossypium australe]